MTGAALLPLDNPVQNYAWGSQHVIPELLGRSPSGEPVAELWLGAHPAAPSRVRDGAARPGLHDVLAEDPSLLGVEVQRRFGQLPFLLKILAVDKPLSLQAHPSKSQAKVGFAAENAAGVPVDSPIRNYRDANHKPEQICALTPFDGLCGFRPVTATAEFLDALAAAAPEHPALAGHRDRLLADGGLRDVVTDLLSRSAAAIAGLLADLVPAARRLAGGGGRWAAEADWIVRLDEFYPGDRGTVIATLLNLVHLEPGEAMSLPAGELHAYLHGVGVELLANSDNVLRGGLTPKHIDVPALLGILALDAHPVDPIPAGPMVGGVREYPSPVADFALSRVELDGTGAVDLPAGRPRILLCTGGQAVVAAAPADPADGDAPTAVDLGRGSGVFVGAGGRSLLSGNATVFVAQPNC
jgi:mannose-6-phosphate isomerase